MDILLKPLDEVDPVSLAKYANDERIGQYLRNDFPYPYTLDHAYRFINESLKNNESHFGIVADNECIGCISVTFYNDIYQYTCEIGYWLSPLYWNKGIMSSVINNLCHILFEDTSVHKITAQVFHKNFASMKVLEKCGFEKEGFLIDQVFKNNRFYDIVLYSKFKGDNYGDYSQ